ncbi:TPA: hypothetical protein ACXEZB_004393 [Escherichia coli]
MSDMYFDPSEFDFTSLVDVVEHEAPQEKALPKLSDIGPDGGAVEDISDLSDLFTEEEAEEKEIKDINDDASDLMDKPETDPELITIVNDLPDDAPLDFGGEVYTKAQIKEYLSAKKDFDTEKELVGQAAKDIDQIHRHIHQTNLRHATAIDNDIADLQKLLNGRVSETEYGQISRALNQKIQERNDLNARVDEQMKLFDVERYHATQYRIQQTDQQMRKEFPQWDQLRGGLLADLQSRGVNLGELEKVWCKDIAMMAINDYRYRNSLKKAGEKALAAAKAKAPRSIGSSANHDRQKSIDSKEAERAKLRHKMRNGGLTKEENAKAFDLLID